MSKLLDELKREVAEQRTAAEAARRREARIVELLVRLRVEEGWENVGLEQEIGRFWDRGTISRKTSARVAACRAAIRA